MEIGQEKFDNAVKLYKTMLLLAPEDETKFIYDEYGNELYAMDEDFVTHDSIMALQRYVCSQRGRMERVFCFRASQGAFGRV